jgi:hypothetical protein
LKAGIVEPEETSTTRQRLGKQVTAATDTEATIEELLGTMFSVENRQSSSGVPSEQSIESWALQGRLRRWRYEFSWQWGCEEKTLRVL